MTEIVLATVLLTSLVLLLSLGVMGARSVLLPSRPVTITINTTRKVAGTTGEKLLSILNNAGIPVPSACAGAGTCGLCRVTVLSGAGDPLPTETARLDRDLVRQGVRLACQVVVREPLEVTVPDEILVAESWQGTVASNVMLAPLIKELVLELPAGRSFTPRAGSFVQLTAPAYDLDFADIEVAEEYAPFWEGTGLRALKASSLAPVSRAYSIANTPSDVGRVVLNIRLAVPPPRAGADTPPGIVSSYLFNLKPGELIAVSGPFGDFYARDSDREMVFIGGGVGMAPLRAIIFDQLERLGTTRPISFWYGARSARDLYYHEEFDRLANRHDNFSWTVALSDPASQDEWPGATGFIHEVLFQSYLKDHPAPESCEYYLCGPPLMIQAVLAMLDEIGTDRDLIFNDDFGG